MSEANRLIENLISGWALPAGGDCLNVGCVPSKALLRAARAVREVRRAARFGVVLGSEPTVDFGLVQHIQYVLPRNPKHAQLPRANPRQVHAPLN